jgi:hypothetical protein
MTTQELTSIVKQLGGRYNHAPLVEVRQALQPMTRQQQDALIHQARLEWRITVSGLEGRCGTTPEERTAAILEDGLLLGYMHVRH